MQSSDILFISIYFLFLLAGIINLLYIPFLHNKIKEIDMYFYGDDEFEEIIRKSGGYPVTALRSADYGFTFLVNRVSHSFSNYRFSKTKPITGLPKVRIFFEIDAVLILVGLISMIISVLITPDSVAALS